MLKLDLLVLTHWNHIQRLDMLLHLDTLFWFRVNQFLLFHLNVACLAEKQQLPISLFSVWPDRVSNSRDDQTALEVSTYANHYTTDAVESGIKYS